MPAAVRAHGTCTHAPWICICVHVIGFRKHDARVRSGVCSKCRRCTYTHRNASHAMALDRHRRGRPAWAPPQKAGRHINRRHCTAPWCTTTTRTHAQVVISCRHSAGRALEHGRCSWRAAGRALEDRGHGDHPAQRGRHARIGGLSSTRWRTRGNAGQGRGGRTQLAFLPRSCRRKRGAAAAACALAWGNGNCHTRHACARICIHSVSGVMGLAVLIHIQVAREAHRNRRSCCHVLSRAE